MADNLNPEIGKYIVAAGIKTNYMDDGEGFPIVLLHGSGPGVTGYSNWRTTIPALSPHFRVLSLDVAGFGYTEREPNAKYDLDYWVRHVIGFMDELGVKKAHLVGNSFGGALSLAIANRHPDRVDRIVLNGAAGTEFRLTKELGDIWGYEPSRENMRRLVYTFAHNRDLITDQLIEARYVASVRPGSHEIYSQLFSAPFERHIKRLATPDDKLRALPHRVLVIHGREDQIVPVEGSIKMSNLIPRAELHIFSHCGHWTQIEKRDRFHALVLDFLLTADSAFGA
jgi:2-hydroxymuconate-semialdehyde hydrolase